MMLLLTHDIVVLFSLCVKTSGMVLLFGGDGDGDCDDYYVSFNVTL
jgi:hypothetical protein